MSEKIHKLNELFELFIDNSKYRKLITYYGNVNSEIVILAESPKLNHYNSESNSIFCFDLKDFNQKGRSGEVILKVFKDLKLDYNNYYFDNIYKIPIENLKNSQEKKLHIDLLKKELEIISPDLIICLGNTTYDAIKNENISYKIIKLKHPASLQYNSMRDYPEYLNDWRKAFGIKY